MKGLTSQGRLDYMLASVEGSTDVSYSFLIFCSLCLHVDSQQTKSKPAFLHPLWKIDPLVPSLPCSVTHSYPPLSLPNWLLFGVWKGTLYDDRMQGSRGEGEGPVTQKPLHPITHTQRATAGIAVWYSLWNSHFVEGKTETHNTKTSWI